MKMVLIMLNIVAALLVWPAMRLVDSALLASGRSLYIELDRVQALDKDRIKELYPKEFANDRYDVPKHIVGWRKAAWMLGYPCMAGFGLNAILIGVSMKKKKGA